MSREHKEAVEIQKESKRTETRETVRDGEAAESHGQQRQWRAAGGTGQHAGLSAAASDALKEDCGCRGPSLGAAAVTVAERECCVTLAVGWARDKRDRLRRSLLTRPAAVSATLEARAPRRKPWSPHATPIRYQQRRLSASSISTIVESVPSIFTSCRRLTGPARPTLVVAAVDTPPPPSAS
ncbi:hypothetical protein K491DRAFT_493385 [Lophiostoma macrostomum CBS 122681]|uniref:Uncharacterized protein n=1 Tax=Lophiostoma macrostomum CBS 122681 TaxID=1314788 RepID=A0A6A6T289_9PLEO|nr:hypothetical protein K491DRAFT_493385 [Lophiostoma macrostomum CBS 122681]